MIRRPMSTSEDHESTHMNQQHTLDFLTTTLTNPGIIDRLELDIADYLSPFGFSMKRNVGGDSAVLVMPRCPTSYYKPSTDEIICNKCCIANGAEAASTQAVLPSLTPVTGPIGTLHLTIHDAALLATVGPLLRTYLRLSPHHLHPMRLHAVIHCKFTLDALEKIDKMSLEQKLDHLNRQETMNARRMAHHLHMLVRNSMGSALCLTLDVVLPWYWRRKSTREGVDVTINSSRSPYTRTKVLLSTKSVQMAMRDNPDACYPTIKLVEQNNANGITDDHSVRDACGPTTLSLHVQTRMCTVRHQPSLFRWISSWQDPSTIMMHSKPHRVKRFPLVVVCMEKVGNLHRILMLLNDHEEKNLNIDGTSENSLSIELIVIMPTTANEKQHNIRCSFDKAIDNFHQVDIGEELGIQLKDKKTYMRPMLVYEDDAAETISELAIRRQSSSSTRALPRIIGIDLHPDALTLTGDYATAAPISPALQTMRDADAIIFGYESTGIPTIIANRLLNGWVQIPSRSSINVVAAVSIVLDALAWS